MKITELYNEINQNFRESMNNLVSNPTPEFNPT